MKKYQQCHANLSADDKKKLKAVILPLFGLRSESEYLRYCIENHQKIRECVGQGVKSHYELVTP